MGAERKDQLTVANSAKSERDRSSELKLRSKRLVEDSRQLLQEAMRLVEECSARRKGERWPFTVTCPEGHEAEQRGFDRAAIRGLLRRREAIPLHCPICDRYWTATPEQRARLEWSLRNSL